MRRLLLCLCLLSLAVISPAAAQEDGNLLVNSSFDSEVYTPVSFDPLDTSVYMAVPEGWNGAVIQSPRSQPWENIHPTGLPHIGGIKVDGYRSYHVARGGATFTAYIFQQVNVQPGTPVEGGAWVFIEGGTGTARVGIDPNGGTNPFAPGIIWSGTEARGTWSTPRVNATANNGTVTIFLFASQSLPSNPNGVYWDAAFVRGTAGTPPPSVEQPGSPAQATLRASVGRLNVRTDNNLGGRVIGVIGPDNLYEILESQNGWYRIKIGRASCRERV